MDYIREFMDYMTDKGYYVEFDGRNIKISKIDDISGATELLVEITNCTDSAGIEINNANFNKCGMGEKMKIRDLCDFFCWNQYRCKSNKLSSCSRRKCNSIRDKQKRGECD